MKKFFMLSVSGLMLSAGVCFGAETGTWADAISFKGDLRLRFEHIDQDDKDETRERWRGRARLSVKGQVAEDWVVGMRLASGSDDPVSSNQSFGDGFDTKDFKLDRAYLEWTPSSAEGLTLNGGKTALPFYRIKDLIWDGDFNPEGFNLMYASALDAASVFANAGIWFAEERSSDDDTYMYGVQVGSEFKPADSVKVTAGASYYLWDNMAGFSPLFEGTDSFGNTVLTVGEEGDESIVYADEYQVFEAFVKAGLDVGMPLAIYADYIVNTETEQPGDTGYMVGATLGKASDPGSWQLDYNYRDLEADATVAAYTDSDSFGGGTNGEGHKLQGKYQISKNLQSVVSLFLQSLDPDGSDVDFTRLQVDLVTKF